MHGVYRVCFGKKGLVVFGETERRHHRGLCYLCFRIGGVYGLGLLGLGFWFSGAGFGATLPGQAIPHASRSLGRGKRSFGWEFHGHA